MTHPGNCGIDGDLLKLREKVQIWMVEKLSFKVVSMLGRALGGSQGKIK